MLRTLHIENFRAFEQFDMTDLGRINLLVGTNNCGKTSLLEAVQLLVSHGDPSVLARMLVRRGERLFPEPDFTRRLPVDVRHLFRGRVAEPGSWFRIATNEPEALRVEVIRDRQNDVIQAGFFDEAPEAEGYEFADTLALRIEWQGKSPGSEILPFDGSGLEVRPRRQGEAPERLPIRFITTESLRINEVIRLFGEVQLTPEEDRVLDALRTIEPNIERMASIPQDELQRLAVRGGLIVRLRGVAGRVPIGSMGDGIWRLLGIALSLVRTPGGVLLIDEIDTGLHHTVMGKMWKLVMETAKRLNVQVFATTHSLDCYTSLAEICRADAGEHGEVSIQRIEKGQSRAVSFNEEEIVIAAEQEIEVR